MRLLLKAEQPSKLPSIMLKPIEVPLMGHPDKVCDVLVESVVDEYLRRDPESRMDIQALGSNGMVMLGGVVESKADFDVAEIARQAYANVGYTDPVEFFVNLERPRRDPGQLEAGASGTTIVYGYATRETRELLPRAVVYGNSLARRIDDLRRTDGRFSWLRPDGKVQVVMQGDRPKSIVVIVAHEPSVELTQVQQLILEQAIGPVFNDLEGTKILINPSGRFTEGGFLLNAGVSGRKVLADTYGGLLPHGGISLTGKDPHKPSRAGTFMARLAARELLQRMAAPNVLVTAIYAFGNEQPILLTARSGDGRDLSAELAEGFDFRPRAIVERLNLQRPLYAASTVHGMFMHSSLPWEEGA